MPYSQAIIAPNVVARVFRTQNKLKKNMYSKTSSHGAQAVMGHETNVQMKNTQKNTVNTRVSCLVTYNPRYCQCYHHSFSSNQKRMINIHLSET